MVSHSEFISEQQHQYLENHKIILEEIQQQNGNKFSKINMSKRKPQDEVILIEEEPENSSLPPPTTNTAERVAVRIVSKEKVNQNGATRFLVKWKNHSEETWETEEYLRNKYPELVDDYEYHRLTDQRLSKAPSNERMSRKAVKQASKPSVQDTQQVTHKSKRSMQALKQMSTQQQQQFTKLIATPEDKVEKVSLIGGLFKIEWRKRPDGDTPFSDHFSYEQLSQTCSLVCMKFIENIVFERSDRTFPVQFYCEGETYNDRYQAVQYAIHGRKVTDPMPTDPVQNESQQPDPVAENGSNFQVQLTLDEQQPNHIEGELIQTAQNETTAEHPQDQQLQLVIEVSVPNSPNHDTQREQSHAPELVQPIAQEVQQVQPAPEVVITKSEPTQVNTAP